MESQIWVVSTLLISIVLIVLTIVKLKFHPFLALLLASFFVGAMMGMGPLEMVNAIESGIGGTLGFLAATSLTSSTFRSLPSSLPPFSAR